MKLKFPEEPSAGPTYRPWRFFPPLPFCAMVVILMLADSARSLSAETKPGWHNPCGFPEHVFNQTQDMAGAPYMRNAEIYDLVQKSAFTAKMAAEALLPKFVAASFPYADPQMMQAMAHLRNRWLPRIPTPANTVYKTISEKEALVNCFTLLQYFAVGFEQTMWDQERIKGKTLADIKDLDRYNTQLMCELHIGMFVFKTTPNPAVLRRAMLHEYRNVDRRSMINVRDYLLLRDYVKAAEFVYKQFIYLSLCGI